jgi:DNA-binding NtrC family response regulator
VNQVGSLLVVDDEAEVGEVLREFFEGRGYAVTCALNGRDALVLASLTRPDAVLLDVRMPERAGPDVLLDLLALDDSIPVIMMSGNDNETIARDLRKAGAFDFLPKPLRFDHLAEVVRLAVLAGKRKTLPDDDGSPWQCDSRTLAEETARGVADTRCGGCGERVPDGDATAVRERDGLYHATCWLTRFTDYVSPGRQLARS